VKVSHILLGVNASAETIDSLENILNTVKAEVDGGKPLAQAVEGHNLKVQRSPWFGRGDSIPSLGFVPGLSSYAFHNPELPTPDGVASEVLRNDQTVALFVKAAELEAGSRNEDAARATIESRLKSQARLQAGVAALEKNRPALASLASLDSGAVAAIDGATVQDFQQAYEGYIPGLGFASAKNYEALSHSKTGEWSGPWTGEGANAGAVMLKVISVKEPTEAEVETTAKEELSGRWLAGSMNAFGDFVQNLESGATVVNNLDIFYRE
jgi:hypothetical protein